MVVKANAVTVNKAEYERLKELNQELYEIVLELSHYKDSPVPNTLIELAEKVIKKARGE